MNRDTIARAIYDVANKWIKPNFPDSWEPRPFDELDDRERNLHFDYAEAVLALDAWQSIETAPKDGTEILIGSKNYNGAFFCACVKWDSEEGEFMLFNPNEDGWTSPTYGPLYWMPLPGVPGAKDAPPPRDVIGLRQALERS